MSWPAEMRRPDPAQAQAQALKRYARGSAAGRALSALPATAPKRYPEITPNGGGVVAGRWSGANQTVAHSGTPKKLVLTLEDLDVNVDGLTYTSASSGTVLEDWPEGLYDLTAACSVWYTSPSGGFQPSLTLFAGAVAWVAQWIPPPLPATATEKGPICFSLPLTNEFAPGDNGVSIQLDDHVSGTGDTVNASAILTVVRRPGYPGP